MVAEIIWLPKTGFSCLVTWHRVLLLGIGSSRCHILDPGPHSHLFQALDIDINAESVAKWKDEWDHNTTIAGD